MLSVSIIVRVLRRFGGGSPTPAVPGFLLCEDGARLILETGENVLLER